jgi:hypothetical protein
VKCLFSSTPGTMRVSDLVMQWIVVILEAGILQERLLLVAGCSIHQFKLFTTPFVHDPTPGALHKHEFCED